MAETGNSIAEKELDVGKQVMSGGTSGEQILNPNDDDQSVDETSQTGNGVSEPEGVSDGALAEPIKNPHDNKSVVEMAVNSVGEKESDAVKQVIMYDGASGEQSQIQMMMTRVLMKPHKREMVLVNQKGCLMVH